MGVWVLELDDRAPILELVALEVNLRGSVLEHLLKVVGRSHAKVEEFHRHLQGLLEVVRNREDLVQGIFIVRLIDAGDLGVAFGDSLGCR